jgi:hypothetical protein
VQETDDVLAIAIYAASWDLALFWPSIATSRSATVHSRGSPPDDDGAVAETVAEGVPPGPAVLEPSFP